MKTALPVEEILQTKPALDRIAGENIGRSREGRPMVGFRFGHGHQNVSLIAGCHADEPVGPAMLDRLVAWLASLPAESPILQQWRFFVVPHTNPDGEARNNAWTGSVDLAESGAAYDLATYLGQQVRELPGDDVEFGFPRHAEDATARPENQAIAEFLRRGAPFVLHASFHGMAFAAGPWFLLERGWADRTVEMRQKLRDQVRSMGYQVHDIDRRGDKGFHRIDEGFTSRPDSKSMIHHFEERGDFEKASLFRPSSMEFVRSLGGDPLTLVSEMPLFLLTPDHFQEADPIRPRAVRDLVALAGASHALRRRAQEAGLQAMRIDDQMRLQLSFLNGGLEAVG